MSVDNDVMLDPKVAKLLADLLKKLGGRNGKLWVKGLTRFLNGDENPWRISDLPIVKIGTHKDKKSLRDDLEKSGVIIDDRASGILDNMVLSEIKQSLSLAFFTTEDLGVSENSSIEYIREVAKGRGFVPCPADVGPQLLLQFSKLEGFFLIIMERVKDSKGDLNSFNAQYLGGKLFLDTEYTDYYNPSKRNVVKFWTPLNHFVFVKPN